MSDARLPEAARQAIGPPCTGRRVSRRAPAAVRLAVAALAGVASLAQAPPVAPPVLGARPPAAPPPPFSMVAQWTTDLESAPSFPPIDDQRRVFVALRAGSIAAIDVATGRVDWSASLTAAAQPAVSAGRVLVATADRLVALDAATGAQAWARPIGEGVSAPLAADARLVVSCRQDGAVTAASTADGSEVWTRRLDGRAESRPVVEGSTVYVLLADGGIAALEVATGTPEWTARVGAAPSGLARDRDRVFAGARDNYLYCLDARTGRLRWKWRSGADIVGAPATDGRRVYYAALDNQLYALDRGNGHQRWKRPLPTRPGSGPLRFGDLLLVSGLSPMIRAFRASNGTPAGEAEAPDELAGPPLIVGRPDEEPGLIVVTGAGQVRLLVPGQPAADPVPPKK